MSNPNYLWGIDLGGTKIEGVVLHKHTKEVLFRERIATEADQGYEHIQNRIAQLFGKMEAASPEKCARLGIGTPGAIDPNTQLMKNSNTTCLIGKPFGTDLTAKLGVDIRFANDANCFALAEAVMGAVPDVKPDAEVVFGIIMGTGVGGGIVVNGKVLNGAQGIAGEWGHNFLDDSGGPDYAGLDGCVETILSGPALERWYTKLCGEKRGLKDIVARHREGHDAAAKETIDRLSTFFAKAIAPIINTLDPHVIVLGGGVSNIDELYTDGVEKTKKHIFNNRLDTLFLKPKLGDSAGVFGAALL
jgi:predicted NBD/HSP70 family sugar kinase